MSLPTCNGSFLKVLEQAFLDHADRDCIRCGGARYSYADVDSESSRIANKLVDYGFKPGMKGAVYALNSPEGFIATIGIIRAGGTWIPVNPRNSAVDNVANMSQLECDVVFYQDAFADSVSKFSLQNDGRPIIVSLDTSRAGAPTLPGWLAGAGTIAPAVDINPDDLISIPLTGGTTGLAKGVMLSHANFCALDYNTRASMGDRKYPVWLCAAPMTHVGGRMALTSMSSGATFVILDQVDPQEVLHSIERESVTDLFLPPTAIYTLLEQQNIHEFDLSSLVKLGYGSAPMSTDKIKQALRVLGPVMVGGYGQTECPMAISCLSQEDHFVNGEIAPDKRLSSVGKATAISQLAILDEEGKSLPAGELGEIAVKGPMVSLGYYRSPEETAKIRLKGWHLTGDLGYLDEDGFLYISDRKKDLIITGGFNVYSAEVEQALMAMAEIRIAIVIGVPSDKWGEEVKALVQLEAGTRITAEQVVAYAKDRLGSVKAPKSVEFIENFPRTAIGKIDKKAIRAPYWQRCAKQI